MFDWLFKNRVSKSKVCNHDQNYKSRQYLLEDGTPMIEFTCLDCHFRDRGPVHGDGNSVNWVKTIICCNGEISSNID
jgi:hypothetical protein